MKVVVIGGGPAGMMAAITSAKQGNDVILLEKMKSCGRKLLITGKGRCNITSSLPMDKFIENIPENGKFLYSAFKNFTNQDIITLLKENNVNVKEERGNRIFPLSDRSLDVLQAFENEMKKNNVKICTETEVKEIKISDNTVNKVIQAGKNGIKEVTYKVRYKGDVEVERIELSSKVIKEPVNKIVQIQTVTSRSTSRGAGVTTASSGRYKVTAYCSCARCCGKTNGVTASGKRATANHTVAAPSTFAFGTQMVINGKTYVVEDRGGAIQGNRIDVYMNSHAEAIAWGVRYLDVEVIK